MLRKCVYIQLHRQHPIIEIWAALARDLESNHPYCRGHAKLRAEGSAQKFNQPYAQSCSIENDRPKWIPLGVMSKQAIMSSPAQTVDT